MLNGTTIDANAVSRLASQLEVSESWLLGKAEDRKH